MASVPRPDSRAKLDGVHPEMVRVEAKEDPARRGEEALRALGQALEWALEQARVEKKEAAYAMGYTHHGVISEWIAGRERIQLDKLKAHLPRVYVELLFALLEMESNVEVARTVTMRRTV